jgi:hypothetical protein
MTGLMFHCLNITIPKQLHYHPSQHASLFCAVVFPFSVSFFGLPPCPMKHACAISVFAFPFFIFLIAGGRLEG